LPASRAEGLWQDDLFSSGPNPVAAWEKSMLARSFFCWAAKRMRTDNRALCVLTIGLAALISTQANAAEVRLFSAAAMQSVFRDIASEFERTSGHSLTITYATMGAFTQRVLAGETADIIIGSEPSIATLVKEGKVRPDSEFTLCKVGVGMVVASGTQKPTVTSIENFKAALLNANTIIYADPAGGGAAGIHISRVIESLGLGEQLKSKTRFGAGGDVTEVTLAAGPGALGLTQISEIVNKRGAELVGSLPEKIQNYTVVAVGTPFTTNESHATEAFVAYLRSPKAMTSMTTNGMQVD
jgi:molybdate transport system substrate-binding protein